MDGRKLGGVLVTVAIIAGVVWMRFRNRDDASGGVQRDMQVVVATMDGYDKHQAYLKPLAERAHKQAFDQAYSVGGRRRSAKFDDDKYVEAFFAFMIQSANAEGRRELVPAMIALRDKLKTGN